MSDVLHAGEVKEEEGERGDLSFLQDLLSPGAAGGASDFSTAWQDAFGCFEDPSAPVAAASQQTVTANTHTGFLPSHLLDHSLSTTGLLIILDRPLVAGGLKCKALFLLICGSLLLVFYCYSGWATPPMFQAPPLQPPSSGGQTQPTQNSPNSSVNGASFTIFLNTSVIIVLILIFINILI